MSSFFEESQESQSFCRISMPYYPPVTIKLVPALRKHNIEFVPKSVKTVRSLLGSTKDPIHFFKKECHL